MSDQELIECFKNSHDEKYIVMMFQKYSFIPIILFKKRGIPNDLARQGLSELFLQIKSHIKRKTVDNLSRFFEEESIKIIDNGLKRPMVEDV